MKFAAFQLRRPRVTRRWSVAMPLLLLSAQPVIVQVREYEGATTVDIVAWEPTSPNWGLRTSVRKNGSLERDHYIFVNTVYLGLTSAPRFVKMLEPKARGLQTTILSDVHNCYQSHLCSPRSFLAARVPEDLMEDRPDSLVLVIPSPRAASGEVTITIEAEVIKAYMATTDSVVAARKHK